MSDKNMARRAAVAINFDGADITSSVMPYFMSLTYVDNEEDETDDLQIRLHDRDDIWLTKWLDAAVDAAASKSSGGDSSGGSGAGTYKVTPAIGLNVRSGPSTSYKKYGALVCGTVIEVSGVSGGWATITYNGKTAYVSADYIKQTSETPPSKQDQGPSTVLKIQAAITAMNWKGDGGDTVLDCGQFELDSVQVTGPPSLITLKATSLPYTSQIRQTKKSKAWEAYTLSGIANEMAGANGMTCLYLSAQDPYYERVEQYKTSDIAFLSDLCHDAGISLKASNNILVLFDQVDYESKGAVLTLQRGAGGYEKYTLGVGSADSLYSSCRVRYTTPEGKLIEGVAKVEDYKEDAKNNQQLEVTAKVANAAEAKALAEKLLRLHNKYSRDATFTLPGNPGVVAGITVELKGWGGWNGKYIVKQASHTVDGDGGYTTQIKLRRVLEGY